MSSEKAVKGDMTGPVSAQMILRDPSVDAAVMETARGGMLRSGLGYRSSNVSACLNIAADHLGLKGVETLADLAEVKRVVVEVATDADSTDWFVDGGLRLNTPIKPAIKLGANRIAIVATDPATHATSVAPLPGHRGESRCRASAGTRPRLPAP